ncbi:patatin-like phospholipase family protein [Candidatus Odyssella acanthamoebae]|uniref:Patatin n=1 Tax=Candidatus Odyssella acanthamoebae TaxID=91604 RepID=A0A077AVV1_9PROT|nr:patatin-like phospholipase family protein [Candidatus Paracaedibacter acanthamoebae]AIK96516.1 patatin [Candidatus Paracaedibacter acanthamoebae]
MAPKKVKKINLALQGGGAHGAFTWGVLDRLLEEEDLEIEGISGTSAGAMNAAILAHGYAVGGRQKAKEALQSFWWEISLLGKVFNPIRQTAVEKFDEPWNLDWSLSYTYYELMSHILSPYQSNPMNLNPLKWVLEKSIDFTVFKDSKIKLFVAATSVRTGQPKIFNHAEITVDSLMASACIPFIFQSVKIDDEFYWDGGYMGNPVLWPLIYNTKSDDIILVQINPLYREQIPQTAHDIANRLNEITFNSSLVAEMRAINFVSRLISQGKLNPDDYKDVKIHMITDNEGMKQLNASSKLNTDWAFFKYLKAIGRDSTEQWLAQHKKDITVQPSINIFETFLRKK